MKLFAKWFGRLSEPWLVDWISEPLPVMFVCFLCSKKLRMIPVFRGCFYLPPSYHKVDKILGVCHDYDLAINVCESPPRLLTLSKLQVKKEWLENIVFTPEIQHGTPNEGLEDAFPFQMGDFQVPC